MQRGAPTRLDLERIMSKALGRKVLDRDARNPNVTYQVPSSVASHVRAKRYRQYYKVVPGEIRAPGFTELDQPQRDDLTTNRQGPLAQAILKYIVYECSLPIDGPTLPTS